LFATIFLQAVQEFIGIRSIQDNIVMKQKILISYLLLVITEVDGLFYLGALGTCPPEGRGNIQHCLQYLLSLIVQRGKLISPMYAFTLPVYAPFGRYWSEGKTFSVMINISGVT